jgi:hypothetical protein
MGLTVRPDPQSFCSLRKPYFATTQVAKKAKIATATADGRLVLSPPALFAVMLAPQIAVIGTAIHIAAIAKDAHISLAFSCADRWPVCGGIACGSCEIVVISSPFAPNPPTVGRGRHPCRRGSPRDLIHSSAQCAACPVGVERYAAGQRSAGETRTCSRIRGVGRLTRARDAETERARVRPRRRMRAWWPKGPRDPRASSCPWGWSGMPLVKDQPERPALVPESAGWGALRAPVMLRQNARA